MPNNRIYAVFFCANFHSITIGIVVPVFCEFFVHYFNTAKSEKIVWRLLGYFMRATLTVALIFCFCPRENFRSGKMRNNFAGVIFEDYAEETNLIFHLNGGNDSYTVASVNKFYGKRLTIPPTHNGLPVTAIGEYAFRFCPALESVIIDGNITSIGALAFYDCPIKIITIGSRVDLIGENAFHKCTKIESIKVASDNKKYRGGGNCLIETESKTLILGCKNSVIPSDGSVTEIGFGAFRHCAGLNGLTVPDGVTDIAGYAFYCCTNLTTVTLSDSIRRVGSKAFFNCPSLKCINFNGTAEKWTAVKKDEAWNLGINSVTVRCTDGKLDKNGNPV